jgi:hypothetical protein
MGPIHNNRNQQIKEHTTKGCTIYNKKNYGSREDGCLIKMLKDLDFPSLATRRQHQRLIFFYKMVEDMIPASQRLDFIESQKPKRQIRARKFENHESRNIISNKKIRINSRTVTFLPNKTDQHKNSLFTPVRTAMDWTHLEESIVNIKKIEEFKSVLSKHHD